MQPLVFPETDAPLAEEQVAESSSGVCRKLRTKMAFLPLRNEDGEALCWHKGDGGTAVYWCLRTMECAGPDGSLVHGSLCGEERSCFEPTTS
jgi:hypothetical protein